MSYIDLFKHREVGNICGLPLYLALENIDGDEFKCKTGSVIIGGGGGEHPGMVIKDLDILFSTYNFYNDPDYDFINNGCPDYFNNLDYSTWSIKDIVQFHENCIRYGFDENDEDLNELEAWIQVQVFNEMKNDLFKKEN
jgi:hypothetical protein